MLSAEMVVPDGSIVEGRQVAVEYGAGEDSVSIVTENRANWRSSDRIRSKYGNWLFSKDRVDGNCMKTSM